MENSLDIKQIQYLLAEKAKELAKNETVGLKKQPVDDKKLKNQKKKLKKKRAKERKKHNEENENENNNNKENNVNDTESDDEDLDNVEIEYVDDESAQEDPLFKYFSKVFEAFKVSDKDFSLTKNEEEPEENKGSGQMSKEMLEKIAPKAAIVERMIKEEEEAMKEKMKEMAEKPKISKKKLRILTRPTIAELKASINRPDVVEWHDVTAKDPKLLVHLKSLRNTVPVPRHWCFKRKYLAGKRGFEKPPFQLPEFIRRTGIMEMRQALQEKEDEKTLKTKMREKIRPKLGKIDIDYQKLHDAFFRWQTKPKMSAIGDLYYEGKELESKMRDKKPGELTDDLRIALGMPVGPNAGRFPPPWLIAMQRYGPPPSYPNLKIAGLNAPIPEGCSFGYHAGGWGKPPVDENGRPLYGDVFGVEAPQSSLQQDDEEIEHKPWGELESEESSSDEEEEEEEHETDETGLVTPAEGLITPSGISSGVPTGVETPDSIELRKRKMQEEGVDTPATGTLYTVLPEKRVERLAGQMMASTHVYDLTTAAGAAATSAAAKKDQGAASGVEVSLNPEELDLVSDTSGLQRKYDEGLRQQQSGKREDLSDFLAENLARQNRKRKTQEDKKQADNKKKLKDFKF